MDAGYRDLVGLSTELLPEERTMLRLGAELRILRDCPGPHLYWLVEVSPMNETAHYLRPIAQPWCGTWGWRADLDGLPPDVKP